MLIKCLHWEIPMETWCDRWMCVCVKPLFHKDKVYKSSLDPPQYHTNANKMSPLRNPNGGMVCDRCVSTEYNSTRYQLWVGGCVCVCVCYFYFLDFLKEIRYKKLTYESHIKKKKKILLNPKRAELFIPISQPGGWILPPRSRKPIDEISSVWY